MEESDSEDDEKEERKRKNDSTADENLDVLQLFLKEKQDRLTLLARYESDKSAGLMNFDPSEPLRPKTNYADHDLEEAHRPSSPTSFDYNEKDKQMQLPEDHHAELTQILDVLEGDDISLNDIFSTFMVYQVSKNPMDIEVALRELTDHQQDSMARHKIQEVYQEVKKLSKLSSVSSGVHDDDTGAPVIGENVLVLVQDTFVEAKILDIVVSEGKRSIYRLQMTDGTESSQVRSNLYTQREASVPHACISKTEVLPETKEIERPSEKELHNMGITPENFSRILDFLVRYAFRRSLFCRDWAPYTLQTDMLGVTKEEVEALVSHNWDSLQESVAPQMATVLSRFILATQHTGSEVSAGSARHSDGGKSGVSGTNKLGSEHGSSRVSAITRKTSVSSQMKSQKSANRFDADWSESGSQNNSMKSKDKSEKGLSQHGSVKSKDQREKGTRTRFRRQHGFFLFTDTRGTLDKALTFPLLMLEDELKSAEKSTKILKTRSQNPFEFNLNEREAEEVGVMLGTRATPSLAEEYEAQERAVRSAFLQAKRAAGRRYIHAYGEQNYQQDKDDKLERLEGEWQTRNAEIEAQLKKIKFELDKIEENVYEESVEILKEKKIAQIAKQKLAKACLEFGKLDFKSKKVLIENADDELEAAVFEKNREAEEMERITWLLETYTLELKNEEVNRRKECIRQHEIRSSQEHRTVYVHALPHEPSEKTYFEMACRIQRGVQCCKARRKFKGIKDFWGNCVGTITFRGAMPPLDKNFVLSDGPEIWNYYRDYGICMVASDGKEEVQVIKRYSATRQVQITSPFSFTILESQKFSLRFPEHPETLNAFFRDLFYREDIQNSRLIGRAQLNRALQSLNVSWDQEDLDDLIGKYSKVAPQKLNVSEFLQALDDEKLRPQLSFSHLREKQTEVQGFQRVNSGGSGSKAGSNAKVPPTGPVRGAGQMLKRGTKAKLTISGSKFGDMPNERGGELSLEDEHSEMLEQQNCDIEPPFPNFFWRSRFPRNQFSHAEPVEEAAKIFAGKWAHFGRMLDFEGLVTRVEPATAYQHHGYSVSNDVKGRIAVVDTILDENGRLDGQDSSFYEQASAVQEAGAVACIMINMVGARKIPKQREKDIAHENEGGTFSSTSSASSSDIYGRIFAMPLPHGVDVDMIHIPVIMLAYPNKRWLTTESTLSVKIVDHSKRIPFAIWPFRALSMQEVPDDVHKDKKCVANFLRQALHRIQHDLTAVGSTMFDPANWNRKELEEALAINSWRGSEHTEYSTRQLVEIAQNMNCKHPTVSSARLIQVTLERGRNLPTTPASASTKQAVAKANTNVDSNVFVPVAGVSPDTYVCIDLDGNEAQGQVHPASCNPVYKEQLRLLVPDTENRKEELAMFRLAFDTIWQSKSKNDVMNENDDKSSLDSGTPGGSDRGGGLVTTVPHLLSEDLSSMFSEELIQNLFGGEESLMETFKEYDVNENGYLEWEEFVNLYDDWFSRPSGLKVLVKREKTEGEEEDVLIGSVYVNVDEVEQGQLLALALLDQEGMEVLGSKDSLACLSLRVNVFHLSSDMGVQREDPATDALSILVHSNRVKADLNCAMQLHDKCPMSIILRQYEPEISKNPHRIFRVFVCDNHMTAISQRHHELYFYHLHQEDTLRTYKDAIIDFFWASVATRMRDLAYTKYIFDVYLHEAPAESGSNVPPNTSSSLRIFILGFKPFDIVTHACLYSWRDSKDLGILQMGRLFPPGGIEPDMITLPSGKQASNVDIRVRSEPLEDPLESLPTIWRKKLGKLLQKLEADYEGRVPEQETESLKLEEGKVSFFSCNPLYDGLSFFKNSASKFAKSTAMKISEATLKQAGFEAPKLLTDITTRASTPDSFFGRPDTPEEAARKTAEDVATEMMETANQIKNQMFETANKKLENTSRKLSSICSLS